MSFTEAQIPGLRTHVGEGSAYPYTVPFTQAQLAAACTPVPGLNILPILPAGSVIVLNGLLYRTVKPLEAGSPGPQIGAIVPLGPMRPSVIGPKKVGDAFSDRAVVYWETAANCNYFTASTSATTHLVGYAVSNSELGTGTNGTGSTLAMTPTTAATAYNAVASVTGGTSNDGAVGAYAAADTFMEVELLS